MKKLFIIVLVAAFVMGGQAYAQQGSGKGKGSNKPDKEQKDKLKDKEQDKGGGKDKTDKEIGKDKEVPGQGHAYGKNKDSLQGKEFGQNRAAEAKSKKEAVDNTEANITHTTQLNADTRTKIKQAKEKLEAKKKNKQVTEAEYAKKKEAIEKLEKDLDVLENQNKDVKDNLEKEKIRKQE